MEAINIYAKTELTNSGMARIVIMIDLNRKHVGRDYLNKKVPASEWDPESKRVRNKYPNAALINGIIENTLNRHNNFILKRQAFGLPVTKVLIQRYLKSNGAFESFYETAEDILQTKKLKDGGYYSEDTKRRYRDEVKRMMQYKPELQFNQITVSFLNDYKTWLQNTYLKKNKKRLDKNSIWKALAFIRMIYNEAIKREIILRDGNPFKEFEVGTYQVDLHKIKYIELHEIDRLEQTLLTEEMPELTYKIGWRFLSMCVSGMRISDAMRLNDYFFNDAGDLVFKPHKTRRHDNLAKIPITTERQRRYFKMTLQHEFPETDPKNFRTTFNNNLKVLAAMAGISINLTSHVGRHTMGGFLVDAGVETKPAMAMMGVKSKKTIEIYMHLKNDKLRNEANKLGNVM